MRRSAALFVSGLCFILTAVSVAGDGPAPTARSADRTAGLHPPKVATTPPLDNRWTFGALMNYVGRTRMVAGDIDDDGRPELILGSYSRGSYASNSYFVVLQYRPSEQDYYVAAVGEYIPEGISTLSAFDADDDGIWEIYVGLIDGGVRVFDGATLDPVAEIVTTDTEITRILLADGDNDLQPEVVVIGESTTELFHHSTLDLENTIPYGADDGEVGNVDLTAGNEIVYSDGNVIRIIGYDTADLLWTQPDGFDGNLIDLGNVDLDPALEIISGGIGVTAYDYGVDAAKWNVFDDWLDSMQVVDVTGDGVPEVIAGNNQWGDIYCYDVQTQATLWSIDNPEHGTTDVGAHDLDLDGEMEVYWGAGATSTGEDFLFVHDVASQAREWRSTDLDGPFLGVDFGDVDDDGDVEIVFASRESRSGYNGLIYVFDATFHQLEWKSELSSIPSATWHGVNDVEIADVDGDNETEIVVGTSAWHDGAIHVLNGTTHEVEASYIDDNWAPFQSVVVTDVDNDEVNEIVALSDYQVIVLDGSNGAVEWSYSGLSYYGVHLLAVGDVDEDTVPEIVVVNEDLFVIDGISHDVWQSDVEEFTALDLVDLSSNGTLQIVLGTAEGDLVTYDWIGSEWIETSRFTVSEEEIDGLVGYRDLSNREIIAFGSNFRLSGFHYDAEAILWQSEPLSATVGTGNGLKARSIPDFTGASLLVGTAHSVHQFGGVVEPPMPQLTTSSPTANEDAGTMFFTVQRAGSSGGFVSVEYATSNGSAESGTDYTGAADVLTWNDGDTTDRTVPVSITDDEDLEGNETFNLTLSNVVGGILGSPSQATATILDDDVSYLRLSSSALNVDEDGVQIQLTVTRSGGSDFPVSVQYSTADDSAAAGEDFTATAGTLNWDAGDMTPKNIVVPIIDDDLTEGLESFTVGLSNPGAAGLLGSPNSTTVNILDDDIANLALSSATYEVNERDGVATITVNRTLSTVGAVSVDYQTSNGSAAAGQDYNGISGTLNWGDGDGEPKSFSVTIYEDQAVENTETVNISLSNSTGPAAIVIPDSAVLSITDNDASLVRFANVQFSGVEDDGTAEITVMRVGGDTGAVSVDYATSPGSATPGEDYQASTGSLSWADGESDNKIMVVTLIDDDLVEGNETVMLSLSNTTGNASLGDPSAATLTVFDDESVETQVNTTVANIQTFPRAAVNSSGQAVIVWESQGQDGWGRGVYGRRTDGAGQYVGGEFPVNQTTEEDQEKPDVAVASDSSFVVVWQAHAESGTEIMARRFDAAAQPLSDEFVVNSSASGSQSAPRIAVDSGDRFLVVWQASDVAGSGVFARILDAAGAPDGDEFPVNTTTPQGQDTPGVGGSPTGGFVVVWESYTQDDGFSESVIVRRFSGTGEPLGGESIVNEVIAGDQKKPSVAVVGGGAFLVVWEDSTGQDGSGYSVRGRWFNGTGSAAGSEFTINSFTDGNQRNPSVGAEAHGRAAVVWESFGQDGSGSGIYSRLLDDDGSFSSEEAPLNSYTEGAQYRPSVACSASGSMLAVWASSEQDAATEGIFSAFRQLLPVPEVFRDGFETGDLSIWSVSVP